MREHAEYPIEADAADTDHGDEGGHERDAKAAQVAGHVFIEHAKGVRREDRTHADIADRDDVGIAVEQRQNLAPQADNNDDRGECNDTAFDQADLERLGAAVNLASTVILSHKGGARLAKAVEQVVAHVLQAHGGARCCHDLGAQAVDGGLDDDVGDGKDSALDAGGQADLDDALEGDGVDSQVAWGDADDGVGLEQADKERSGADGVGDGGGDGDARDAPVKYGDKDEVQANVEDGGHGKRLQRHAGDADGAEDCGFKVVEQD